MEVRCTKGRAIRISIVGRKEPAKAGWRPVYTLFEALHATTRWYKAWVGLGSNLTDGCMYDLNCALITEHRSAAARFGVDWAMPDDRMLSGTEDRRRCVPKFVRFCYMSNDPHLRPFSGRTNYAMNRWSLSCTIRSDARGWNTAGSSWTRTIRMGQRTPRWLRPIVVARTGCTPFDNEAANSRRIRRREAYLMKPNSELETAIFNVLEKESFKRMPEIENDSLRSSQRRNASRI